jgi:hypothetical protein
MLPLLILGKQTIWESDREFFNNPQMKLQPLFGKRHAKAEDNFLPLVRRHFLIAFRFYALVQTQRKSSGEL